MGASADEEDKPGSSGFRAAVRAFATPEMVTVLVVAFVFGLTQTMYKPLIAPFAITLGTGPFLAGVAVAAQSFPGLFLAVHSGALVDRFGARRSLIVSAAALVVGGLLLAGIGTLPALFAAMLISGVGTLGIAVSAQGLATSPTREGGPDTRRVASFGAALIAGQLVGPTIGGVLADATGYRTSFWSICVLGLALMAFTLSMGRRIAEPVRDEAAATAEEAGEPRAGAFGKAGRLFRNRALAATIALSFVGVMLLNVRLAFLPLYLDQIGWSSSAIGVLLSGASAAALVARLGFPAVERAVPLHVLLRVTLIVAAGTLALAVMTTNVVVIGAATVASGILLGAVNPSTLTMLARLVADTQRGLAIGLRVGANRAAQAAGPFAIGALSATAGIRVAFYVVTGLSAMGAVASTRNRTHAR